MYLLKQNNYRSSSRDMVSFFDNSRYLNTKPSREIGNSHIRSLIEILKKKGLIWADNKGHCGSGYIWNIKFGLTKDGLETAKRELKEPSYP